jgi:UV DNA damage repair endonuclease
MAIEMRPVSSSISVIDTLSLTNCGTDVSCLRYCQRIQKKLRRLSSDFTPLLGTKFQRHRAKLTKSNVGQSNLGHRTKPQTVSSS